MSDYDLDGSGVVDMYEGMASTLFDEIEALKDEMRRAYGLGYGQIALDAVLVRLSVFREQIEGLELPKVIVAMSDDPAVLVRGYEKGKRAVLFLLGSWEGESGRVTEIHHAPGCAEGEECTSECGSSSCGTCGGVDGHDRNCAQEHGPLVPECGEDAGIERAAEVLWEVNGCRDDFEKHTRHPDDSHWFGLARRVVDAWKGDG